MEGSTSYIEEANRKLEEHLRQKKTQDAIVAVIIGLVFGLGAFFLLGTSGTTSSGGISPTIGTREGWPVVGALAALVGGVLVARAMFSFIRQRRRRRFWGL